MESNQTPLKPKVLAATLTWNQKGLVEECLNSLLKLNYENYEVGVIDHNSSDGTCPMIRKLYPQVHLVRHRENFGFGEGINGQLRLAIERKADYLLSVDNDALVDREALAEMVKVAEKDPSVGVVFPKVLYRSDTRKIWSAVGIRICDINWYRGEFPGLIHDEQDTGQAVEEKEVNLFPGGFSLLRMDAVKKVGYVNPNYFIYFDDWEWFFRLYQAGFSGRYAPKALMWHEPASSIGENSQAFHYYQSRNKLYFLKACAPGGSFKRFMLRYVPELFLRVLPRLLWRGEKRQARGLVTGFLDFLRGKKRNRCFELERTLFRFRWVGRLKMRMRMPFRKGVGFIKRIFGWPLKILVFIDWNMGDEIIAMPVYEALKKRYPRSMIDAAVRFPAILEGHPFVDSVNQSSADDCDLYVNLHQDVRNCSRMEYLPKIAGVPTWGLPKIYLKEPELERVRKKWNLDPRASRIAVNPEVWWLARRWPRENWIKLVRHFADQPETQVFILGTEEKEMPAGVNLIRQTSIREASAIIGQCHLFIGHDSGPLYMALAVGTPSVGLYGPLNPHFLYPALNYFIPLWADIECRGCWPDYRMKLRDHCPKIVPDCMATIPVAGVIAAGESLLSRKDVKTLAASS